VAAVPDPAAPKTKGQRREALEQSFQLSEALSHLAAGNAAVHKQLVHLLKPQNVVCDPDLVERVKAIAAQA
jgi:hypothetical protein